MKDMYISEYKLSQNPSSISTTLTSEKKVSVVQTYSSVAVFSWGLSIVGKTVSMSWEYMNSEQYDELLSIYERDSSETLIVEGITYNIELLSLEGTYHIYTNTSSEVYRKDVNLSIVITGVI